MSIDTITLEMLAAIEKQIGKHLSMHQPEICNAYDTMKEVSISLSCKLTPEDDKIQVKTVIAFVESKVNDKGIIII